MRGFADIALRGQAPTRDIVEQLAQDPVVVSAAEKWLNENAPPADRGSLASASLALGGQLADLVIGAASSAAQGVQMVKGKAIQSFYGASRVVTSATNKIQQTLVAHSTRYFHVLPARTYDSDSDQEGEDQGGAAGVGEASHLRGRVPRELRVQG